jgi:hypothetical protein
MKLESLRISGVATARTSESVVADVYLLLQCAMYTVKLKYMKTHNTFHCYIYVMLADVESEAAIKIVVFTKVTQLI